MNRIRETIAGIGVTAALIAEIAAGGLPVNAQGGNMPKSFSARNYPFTSFLEGHSGPYGLCPINETAISFYNIVFADGSPVTPDAYNIPLISNGESLCDAYGFGAYVVTRPDGTVESVSGLPVWDKKGALVGFLEYGGFLGNWVLQLANVDYIDLRDIAISALWEWRPIQYNDALRPLAERTGHGYHFDWEGTQYVMYAPYYNGQSVPVTHRVVHSDGSSEEVLGYVIGIMRADSSFQSVALMSADSTELVVIGTEGIAGIEPARDMPES